MTKFKWVIVLALCFLLTGCKEKGFPKNVDDETLVQVTWKYSDFVNKFEIYVPDNDKYYIVVVSDSLYNKVEAGSWVELSDLKKKAKIND